MKHILLGILCLHVFLAYCQREGRVWAFGDSSGIDFNVANNPALITTGCWRGYETYASISNSSGNLKLYFNNDKILNYTNQLVENGDSLKLNTSRTQGNLILPLPRDPLRYLLFYISSGLNNRKIRHAVVDMSMNNGLGKIVLKNQKLWSQDITEKLQAVKHANGRDWWVIVHEASTSNFVVFKLTDQGIEDTLVQSIGPVSPGSGNSYGQMKFSQKGDKLAWASAFGRLAISRFDRCTGTFYGWQQLLWSFSDGFYGCELSYSGDVLYVNDSRTYSSIYQFDLTAADIVGSATVVYIDSISNMLMGQIQRGPDRKIYVTNGPEGSISNSWIYKDSFNTHLTVIAEPDSLGAACQVQPYSFSLNNRRCYGGLPNMPNHNLGPVPIYALDTPQLQHATCQGDTITLGIPDTFGVIEYQWRAVNSTWQSTAMQPLVSPDSTTHYVLTRTDTAAAYSCSTRVDTVFVIVEEADSAFIDTAVASGTVYQGATIQSDTTLVFVYKRLGRCDSVVTHEVYLFTSIAPTVGIDCVNPPCVQVWPNPAKSALRVQLSTPAAGMESCFTLYTLTGRIALKAQLCQGPVDVSALPEGGYLWEVETGGQKTRGKVVILK